MYWGAGGRGGAMVRYKKKIYISPKFYPQTLSYLLSLLIPPHNLDSPTNLTTHTFYDLVHVDTNATMVRTKYIAHWLTTEDPLTIFVMLYQS